MWPLKFKPATEFLLTSDIIEIDKILFGILPMAKLGLITYQ